MFIEIFRNECDEDDDGAKHDKSTGIDLWHPRMIHAKKRCDKKSYLF